MTDDFSENQFPDDLQPLADALRAERAVADGHLLERVLARVTGGSPSRRRSWLLSPRTAVLLVLALAVVVGARLSHVNVPNGIATLVGSVTSGTSSSPSGSTSGLNYCDEGTALGEGWAPTFRWHYGAPNPPYTLYDNGWSQSVQPDCESGVLTISLVDNITVQPDAPFDLGYDFHTANKPPYVLTTYNPTAVINYKCSSSGPIKQVTIQISSGNTYNSVTTDWVPTGDKDASAGFQKTGTLGPLCGAGEPIYVLGGTFTTNVKIVYS